MHDPVWLLLFDVFSFVFLLFAFRHLWRAARREQSRRVDECRRLVRIERKLDALATKP